MVKIEMKISEIEMLQDAVRGAMLDVIENGRGFEGRYDRLHDLYKMLTETLAESI